MNGVFQTGPTPNHAPKRSNSGREIVYVQNQRILGNGQPVHTNFMPQHNTAQLINQAMPQDVLEVFNTVFRKYSYKDLHHWLKLDRREEISHFTNTFSPTTPEALHPTARPQLSSSTRTSRTSSVFSVPQSIDRSSFASSRTSWSMVSDPGDHTSVVLSPDIMQLNQAHLDVMSPLDKANRGSTVPATKPTQRQRETELEVKKRYFCTACNKGFARKYDWKVHEQRYHEQQFQYPCPDCNQILYAETHFRSHHRDAHGCAQCTHAKEVTKEVDPRRRRTAWGCGFCGILLDDWEKRCDHIAGHYDEGMKRTEWEHSKVIIGLLRQPDIDAGWQNYLIERHGHAPNPPLALKFGKDTTSRSHGDSLQLQDLLELGAIERDISAIIELAYDQGVRQGPKAALESKGLDTVTEEQESSSISPPTDVPQDSVMGSPSMEPATVPQSSTSYFVSSPMDFTTQTQQPEVQQSPLTMDATNVQNVQNGFFPFGTNGFNESMFQTTSFMSNPHHSTSSFDKALPPLPVEEASIHSADINLLHANGHHDPQVGTFDSWSMLTGTTFAEEGHAMVLPTFDPRNII